MNYIRPTIFCVQTSCNIEVYSAVLGIKETGVSEWVSGRTYRMFHLRRNPNCCSWTPSCTKWLKPREVLNSCSRVPMLQQLMHCLKSVIRRQFQVFCRSVLANTSVFRNIVTNRCIVVLFGSSLSWYALLNASGTAANDFDAKQYLRMNKRFICEYSMLHNWRVNSGLATRATLARVWRGRLGESIVQGWTCFRFHLCTVLSDCFCVSKWCVLYNCPLHIHVWTPGEHVWDHFVCPLAWPYVRLSVWQ